MRREQVYDSYFDENFEPQIRHVCDRTWYTVREAAKKLGVSVRTMRQYVTDGKLLANKEKNMWWIEERTLENFKQIREMSKKGIDTRTV